MCFLLVVVVFVLLVLASHVIGSEDHFFTQSYVVLFRCGILIFRSISINILGNISISIDIDTPAIVARQNGANTQCSIYLYRYLQ